MAFRREVDHDVGLFLLKQLINSLSVANVGFDKAEIGVVHHALERRQIARIGQLVKADDAVVGILPQHMKNKVASNKSGTAGYDDRHSILFLSH